MEIVIRQNTTQVKIMHLHRSHLYSKYGTCEREGTRQTKQQKRHRKEGFSRSPENITASNRKSKSMKELTSVSKITI